MFFKHNMSASEYNAANHDFTMRHALENIKNESTTITQQKNRNPRTQHLWNTASKQTKNKLLNTSRSDGTIQSNGILDATQTFKSSMSKDINLANNSSNNNDINMNDEYSEESARQIVNLFAQTFPSFQSKLQEQFPNEWLNIQHIEQDKVNDANKLFQFSQLERTEREKIIQELYEYGPTCCQK
eukprot:393690_1